MIFRQANQNELATLATLDAKVNPNSWTLENYLSSYANSNHQIFVLTPNNYDIVGSLISSIVLDEAEILQLWISKDWQKKGLAQSLFHNFLLKIKNSVNIIYLDVMITNNVAINLYHKLGFKIITTRKNYYKVQNNRFDALTMQLEINDNVQR